MKRDAKLEKLLGDARITSRNYDSIDPNTWSEPVSKTSPSIAITTYVVRFLTEWEEYKVEEEDIFMTSGRNSVIGWWKCLRKSGALSKGNSAITSIIMGFIQEKEQ
ncbi:hypothetical protein GcM1_118007 [Golovinomyces cichoracearum]|uniref:Uncharacterized protein n=1 Tax=Golovinomyces cichoracearum TaxID=62708 RepID=A0A420JBV7_9PEZI|nr:hypothetical protein GcM1_118007 [Golovinomyces cichoracearum]